MKGSVWRTLAIAVVIASASVGVALAANTAGFSDASSDSSSAPDITAVAVNNDDAGIVTVRLTLANRQVLSASDDLAIGLDVDQNPDTGSVFYGVEYELDLNRGTVEVWRSEPGGALTRAIAPGSLHIVFSSGTVTFTFKASELGVTAGFNVYGLTFDAGGVDAAPDMRTVNYQLVGGAAAPLLGSDTRAPVTEALKTSGVHGKLVRLEYFAGDGRGETADAIVVYKGKKVLKRLNSPLADTSPFLVYSLPWKVPKKTRGKLRFCITSMDRAGNKSKTSCAALTIK